MNQKFLLIAPWDYQLYVVIEKNLRYLGYDVTVVHNNHYRTTLQNIPIKIKCLFRKSFTKRQETTQSINDMYDEEKRISLVKSRRQYDICLVLRADLFPGKLLREAKKRSNKFISFFYDGLTYNQHVLSLVPLFDRFYIFDKTEVASFSEYAIVHAPNFYFTYPALDSNPSTSPNKIYYLSSFQLCRLNLIQSLHQYLVPRIPSIQFDLVCSKAEQEQLPDYIKRHFNCTQTIIPYEEQLKLIQNTEIIIDFKMAIHSGLSFRIYDGIKLRKKVITTNSLVMDEDFYHPNNFFILTQDNKSELDAFLKLPYFPLDEAIRAKYSFENWLKRVTDY